MSVCACGECVSTQVSVHVCVGDRCGACVHGWAGEGGCI